MKHCLIICFLLLAGCRTPSVAHPRKPETRLSYQQWCVVNMLIDPNIFEVREKSLDVKFGLRRYSGKRIAIR